MYPRTKAFGQVRAAEEYRPCKRPFLPPACALVAQSQEMPHKDLHPIAEFPLVTTSQALYLLCPGWQNRGPVSSGRVITPLAAASRRSNLLRIPPYSRS